MADTQAEEHSDGYDDDVNDDEDLIDMFELAATFVQQAVMSGSTMFSDSDKLHLYGLYKQATIGPCNTSKPGFLDFKGRSKWDIWKQLGNMAKEDAMFAYIAQVQKAAPQWEASQPNEEKSNKRWGPVFSTLASSEEEIMDDKDKAGNSLLEAARRGDAGQATSILASRPEAVEEQDDEGCRALHLAADSGSAHVVSLLVQAGAHLNAQDKEGQTPLHYAAICEHQEVCKVLLEAGADFSIHDNDGNTPKAVAPSSWSIWPTQAAA